mmetsp:Transcript_4491/g.14575  ORF Transcript_4491/g.14575 Transcript_4491/m.14575 type:complete len:215 (+) Transcript_4491:799-1443(+)
MDRRRARESHSLFKTLSCHRCSSDVAFALDVTRCDVESREFSKCVHTCLLFRQEAERGHLCVLSPLGHFVSIFNFILRPGALGASPPPQLAARLGTRARPHLHAVMSRHTHAAAPPAPRGCHVTGGPIRSCEASMQQQHTTSHPKCVLCALAPRNSRLAPEAEPGLTSPGAALEVGHTRELGCLAQTHAARVCAACIAHAHHGSARPTCIDSRR